MRYEQYKLYQLVRSQNAIGQFFDDWEFVDDINVVVSSNLFTQVTGDIVYRKYVDNGVTSYKHFEEGGAYKIANGKNEYRIDSFNVGNPRYAQLLLSKVITHV